MSPILYNFAIDPLLCHLDKLFGISTPGHPPLKILAFADDCFLGIKDHNDSKLAESIITEYENASQAKLNSHKSMAIAKNNAPSYLPFKIKYTQEPVRHLGILVNSSGTMNKEMEITLLNKMQSRISLWSNFQPTLKGRVLLFNVFVSSKLWYFVRNFPISDTFGSQIKQLLQTWLWRSRVPPIPTKALSIKTSLGGLSLLDPIAQSSKMFSIWISEVLNPEYKDPC